MRNANYWQVECQISMLHQTMDQEYTCDFFVVHYVSGMRRTGILLLDRNGRPHLLGTFLELLCERCHQHEVRMSAESAMDMPTGSFLSREVDQKYRDIIRNSDSLLPLLSPNLADVSPTRNGFDCICSSDHQHQFSCK
eukprot:scaffold22677_cov139-Cylindrotheca_fusiformis.AAC.5